MAHTSTVLERDGFYVMQEYTPPGGVGNVTFTVIRSRDRHVLGEIFPTGREQDMAVFRYEPTSIKFRTWVEPLPVCTGLNMAIQMCAEDLDRK